MSSSKGKKVNVVDPMANEKLAHVFLALATRETECIRHFKDECDFVRALTAQVRRQCWLEASQVADQKGK